MRVAVLDDVHDVWGTTEGVRRMRTRADVEIFTAPIAPALMRDFDVLVANRERTRFTRELLAELPGVRAIIQTGNHARHIDFAAAQQHGILVAKASAGHSTGAAELTIALMLAVMRQIPLLDAALRKGEWATPSTPALHGKTIGLVGFGGIGRHVGRLARAFEMRVLAWSRSLTVQAATAEWAERRELDELLAQSDVVSIHVPLTTATRGLIDARRMALMKPTAYLVNTARGAVVDELALVEALRRQQIAGAALDVFATEPLPPHHPLTALPNVVLTPHIGWPTDEGYERFAEAACAVLFAYLDGGAVPRFEVDT
jgi:phosphoglycerate dehydrogenase-like enzyme